MNEYKLDSMLLYLQAQGFEFSKRQAIKLLGKGRFLKLVDRGDIRTDKPTNKQNGKWHCNAADVLSHIKL